MYSKIYFWKSAWMAASGWEVG